MVKSGSLWFPRARAIEFREEETGPPGGDQVLAQALYSGISQGTEMLVFRGEAPEGLELDPSLKTMTGSFRFPIKYGYSSVARVVETGPNASLLGSGDVVFVHHPHQTHYTVSEQLAFRLPEGLSPVLGVFAANVETALNCVHDATIRLGDSVAVYGQGVVGLLITQLARRCGAGTVFAVDRMAKRRAVARAVGADYSFDPDGDDPPEAIRERTGGLGADVVIEASGAPDALDSAVKSAAFEGQVVVVSWYGAKPVTLHLGEDFHRRRLHIRSSQVSHLNPAVAPRWSTRRRMETALRLLSELQLDELLSDTFPFDDAARAYEKIEQAPDEVLQVVLSYV